MSTNTSGDAEDELRSKIQHQLWMFRGWTSKVLAEEALEGQTDRLAELFESHTRQQALDVLGRVEVAVINVEGGDIDMKHAVRTHSDAGAGYTIGVNALLEKQRKALATLRLEYKKEGQE